MNPKISIIVPIFNIENYLSVCIESIINQTFKDIEIILVNDGSSDCSGEICNKYSKLDNRIKVFHKENGGLSDARNFGIKHSNGDFIMFVDGDDIIDKKMCQILYELCIENEADIVSCDFKSFREEYELTNSYINQRNIKIYENNIIQANYKGELNSICAWNKIYKSSMFKDVVFPKGRIYEDVSIMYKLYLKCNRLVETNEQLYYYRRGHESITNNSKFKPNRFDIVPMYEEQYRLLNEKFPEIGEIIKHDYLVNLKCIFVDLLSENIENKNHYLYKTSKLFRRELRYFIKNEKISIKDKLLAIVISYMPKVGKYFYKLKIN